MNIIVPIPKATPKRDESPLITPMFAPVDVNMKLLGPGVTAATMEDVVVLHPDEVHDGQAGTQEGLGYQILYIDPGLIFDAARAIWGTHVSLPFIFPPVLKSQKLSKAVSRAFQGKLEPLGVDCLITLLAEGLLESAASAKGSLSHRSLDLAALERARLSLAAEKTRVVRSDELEKLTGLSRYELARQFRFRYGTSPYRYLMMRRLDFARRQLSTARPLSEVALTAGFSDQAHFTRTFKAGLGLTPAAYKHLIAKA